MPYYVSRESEAFKYVKNLAHLNPNRFQSSWLFFEYFTLRNRVRRTTRRLLVPHARVTLRVKYHPAASYAKEHTAGEGGRLLFILALPSFSRILAEKREGTRDELRHWIIPEAPGSPREPSI